MSLNVDSPTQSVQQSVRWILLVLMVQKLLHRTILIIVFDGERIPIGGHNDGMQVCHAVKHSICQDRAQLTV